MLGIDAEDHDNGVLEATRKQKSKSIACWGGVRARAKAVLQVSHGVSVCS